MEKLNEDLMETAKGHTFTDLLETSVKWAEYVLKNNEGKALDHGLEISKSLANYHQEINSTPHEE